MARIPSVRRRIARGGDLEKQKAAFDDWIAALSSVFCTLMSPNEVVPKGEKTFYSMK